MVCHADDKPRQPNSVNAVILHPIEMAIHRLRVLGTEQGRWRAARISEARSGIGVCVFAQVRPHLEGQSVGGNCAGRSTPMNPLAAAVTRAAKPALIAAEDFF